MQMIAWGMCMLQDRRPQPLTPPWAAWFTMFVVVSFLLLTMMPLVYDGPFARSGLLNYFYEFGAFFVIAAAAAWGLADRRGAALDDR